MADLSPDWRAVKEPFHHARELASAEREAFLADARLGNDSLRHDIESC